MKTLFLAFLFIVVPVSVFAQHQHSGMVKPPSAPIDPGVGKVDHAVSTKNASAQRYFNQGLAYMYAFNHDEAVRSFKQASELDPNLAMAYWGIALARGSNYNVQADPGQLSEAYQNLQKAQDLAQNASARDRAYIAALAKRYSSDPAADQAQLGRDYKSAMAALVKQFPNDLDAATLYAESMMNLRPWQLWTLDGKPAEGTLEIVAVLESVLKRDPRHSGANHYYIHAIEASPNPERGLPSARRLGLIAPTAGHLVHMPSHIYIRTGNYADAAKVNADAVVVDRNYIKKTGAQGLYPMMYYNHNVHFLASMNSMNGRFADAIKGSHELEANVRPHLAEMPMLEAFAVYPLVTLVRFHKWDDIKKVPEPEASMKLTAAYRHFARGMAFSANVSTAGDAGKELDMFRESVKGLPAEAAIGNSPAPLVMKVADDLLSGMVMLARGDRSAAIAQLTQAVASGDQVNYDEPPDWDLPVREWLGHALMMDTQYAAAEKVYQAELVKHPRNGRALFGLAESLQKQKKTAAAKKARLEFTKAWSRADTKLRVGDLYR